METNESDIVDSDIKSIFETVFRKNIFAVILLVIIANGYSNIPGMNELLTKIFGNHYLRVLITFILFFQIIDNVKESLIWTIIISVFLYYIEKNHNEKNNKFIKINKISL